MIGEYAIDNQSYGSIGIGDAAEFRNKLQVFIKSKIEWPLSELMENIFSISNNKFENTRYNQWYYLFI